MAHSPMHSRTIAALTIIAQVVLILAGSMLLQQTDARATVGPAEHAPARAADAPLPRLALPAAVGAAPAANPGTGSGAANAATQAAADSLQWLLTRIHVLFEPYSAEVTNEMIPYLADVITLINQRDDFQYRLEVNEPDAELARQRARTLNDVLRLNVLQPANLQITGAEGLHGVRAYVTS